jgi:hypothetical protein
MEDGGWRMEDGGWRMDMTLYHTLAAKQSEPLRKRCFYARFLRKCGCQCGSQRRCNEREMVRELVYNHEPTQAFGDGGSGIFLPSAFCEWLWILVEDVKRY